jgi:hypothetical protein
MNGHRFYGACRWRLVLPGPKAARSRRALSKDDVQNYSAKHVTEACILQATMA